MGERDEARDGGEHGWRVLSCGAGAFGCLLVGSGLLVSHRFDAIFRDLGIRLPLGTEWALQPWSHAVAGIVLVAAAVIIAVARSVAPFVVLACAYIALLAYVLFVPLTTIIEDLGSRT